MLPPLGWAVYTMGYVEGGQLAPPPAILPRQTIRNEHLEVALAQDNQSIVVRDSHQHEVTRISAVTVEDPWGSWGGMGEQPESLDLSAVRHVWQISAAETLESGPLCNVLGVKLSAGRSEMELRFTLFAGRNAVDVATRVLWNERSARLKLAFTNAGDTATFDVPGGTAVRPPLGEVPGGRWVRSGSLGFASDGLFGFDLKDAVLRATVCRAARYADDTTAGPNDVPWLAVVDRGELKFRFLLTADLENLPRLAGELERPPVVLPVPASPGRLGRKGSLIELRPASLALLALKPAADDNGFVVRVQATAACKATLVWLGKRVELGRMTAGEIGTWRLSRTGRAKRVNLVEEG
jgi:alpha-mannosidase